MNLSLSWEDGLRVMETVVTSSYTFPAQHLDEPLARHHGEQNRRKALGGMVLVKVERGGKGGVRLQVSG